MRMATEAVRNPYVGPSAFAEDEARFFFGRDREARRLLSLVSSKETVLFYAPSGAGKTSLIHARLIPGLEAKGFQISLARVGRRLSREVEVPNIYIFNLLSDLCSAETMLNLQQQSLTDCLQSPFPMSDDGGQQRGRILILDQFEEILTTYPAHRDDRDDFFIQIREALAARFLFCVVFVMREDHIAGIDRYAPLMPDRPAHALRHGAAPP